MPLVRLQLRNEYGLGRPELYKGTNTEDPKPVLDGVAVAGLVGILRQLGDLADFAAEVFHGLQEQVLTTASRSHKLMLRAQNIEASLPPLEKAILAQTSHIHFAYTAGCEWHRHSKTEQNHFIYNDLPQFIMDSYEECWDPPCLHLLDKFDPGGPGSCLRRYSDPTFFKRVSAYSDEAYIEKTERARKTSRSKKKRLSRRNGEILQGENMHSNSGRMQFASHVNGQSSSSQTANMVLKSDPEDHSHSFHSRADADYIECVFQLSNSVQLDEQECKESPSSRLAQKTDTLQLASPTIDYNFSHGSFDKQIASTSAGFTWDEREEIVHSKSQLCDRDETPEDLDETQNLHMHENEAIALENIDQSDFLYGEEGNLNPVSNGVQTDEIDSEPDNYLDALNTIESESENDLDCETKREVEKFTSHVTCEVMENGVGATSTVLDHEFYNVFSQTVSCVSLNKEIGGDFPETRQEIPPLISERHVTSLRYPVQSDVPVKIETTKILVASHDSGSPIHDVVPDIGNSVLDCSVGSNPLDDACFLNNRVLASIGTVPSSDPVNIGSKKNLADSHASESPIHEQESHMPATYVLDHSIGTNSLGDAHILVDALSESTDTVPSSVLVNRGRTESLGDTLASANPICEQVPYIYGNSVLDSSAGTTTPLGNAYILNDSVSASIENIPPESFVNLEITKHLADSHASESPIHEQEPHVPATYVLDRSICTNSLGDAHTLDDALSESIDPVPSSVLVNRGRTESLGDTLASENPICEQVPHTYGNSVLDSSAGTAIPLSNVYILNDSVSASIENIPPEAFVNLEITKHLADSHASESPTHEQEPHIAATSVLGHSIGTNPLGDANILDDAVSESIDPVPSSVLVNRGRTESLGDTLASENPICEQLPHIYGNSVLDSSAGTAIPLSNVYILNDSVSASIENIPPEAFVNLEITKHLDSHASESPTHEQEPHIPATYVLDHSIGTNPLGDANILDDAVSESIDPVPSSVLVNRGRTESLGDTLASESPICEQVPHIYGNYVLDSSAGTTIPLGNAYTLNDSVSASVENIPPEIFVSLEITKNLADSHTPESPIREQAPHICGNSVDCSVGTNPLGDYHTLNDSVSASIETDPSDDPINFERTINLADSQVSANTICEQLHYNSGISVFNCMGGTNPLGDVHTLHDTVSASIKVDISSGSKSSDLPDNEADSIDSNICKSKESPSEPTSDPSVGLWTNGGLLGLEPSKPPDFIISNSLNQGSMTSINETDGVLNHNSMPKSNGYKEEQDLSAKIAELNKKEPNSRCLSRCDDHACISVKASDCLQQSSRYSQNDDEDLDEHRVLAAGTVFPVSCTSCTEPIKGSGLNSPLLFGLGHKLLINNFGRKVSFDKKSGRDNSLKTGILEQSGQNSIVQQSHPETTLKEQISYDYPICSPPPSPPLEHMKISFRPVNGFETFKLKLKFPDGSNLSESTRDMFPSFRLVPEPSILLDDSGFNSDDDDTFGRSSPFVSDDCLSPHSDCNSDQWESDDTPDISGHGVSNSSHGISLIESKSSCQEIRVTNVDVNLDSEHITQIQDIVEPSLSEHLLDFPSFDTMKPVLGKEGNKHSDYYNNPTLQGHSESIPPALPLPPKQLWGLSNQQSDVMNEKQNCISNDTEKINDPNISESTLQLRPSLVEQNPTDHKDHEFYDDIPCKLKDKTNQQNMNEQKKENQMGIEKDMDEKDFLHQIRTKSFNLKHTVAGNSNDLTSPATTNKVTAILEKASALRQVVASDDGEDDDNWSDV